jgi:hypothetical protein
LQADVPIRRVLTAWNTTTGVEVLEARRLDERPSLRRELHRVFVVLYRDLVLIPLPRLDDRPTDVLLRLRLRRVTRGYLVDRACAVLVETVRLVDARVAAGLDALDVLAADARLKGHYRLDAVRAHLLEKAGDREAAVAHYRTAAGRTSSVPERNYLVTRAARLA